MRHHLSAIAIAMLAVTPSVAWDGENTDTGASVEIGKGELVREGLTVEYFDYEKGEYREMDIQNMESSYTGGVTIEGTDSETGETIEIEMEH